MVGGPCCVHFVVEPWRRLSPLAFLPLVFQQSGLDHEFLFFVEELASDVVVHDDHTHVQGLDHSLE